MFTRRTVLGAATALVAGVAGCSGDGERTDTATASPGTDGGGRGEDGTPTPGGTSTPGDTPTATEAAAAELDLREANVVAVSVTERGDDHRFDVTLHHDDDGEEGYANWWQVEALDGTGLGRRDLAHPHGTREFTRSATVAVPDGTACVVVRGHDETHGYGGRAALVRLGGETRFVDQGPDPRTFEAADCP